MCIYCGTSKYRKIYENHFGPIPKDDEGRTYEIHHIDGNRKNNCLDNLQCVSIQEHYDIHRSQHDWAACLKIAAKMKLSPDELSIIAKNRAQKAVINGTHPWQKTGKEAPGYNHNEYNFENLVTGECVVTTMGDFSKQYNLSIYGISHLVNGRCKSIYGWKLHGTDHTPKSIKGKNNKGYDPTIFNFENIKTGEIVSMTKCDFYTKYKLDASSVIQLTKQNGKNKTVGVWKIAGTNHYRGDMHTFEYIETGEQVTMYQKQFKEAFNLNAGHVCQMIKQNPKYKTVKGWKLVK